MRYSEGCKKKWSEKDKKGRDVEERRKCIGKLTVKSTHVK